MRICLVKNREAIFHCWEQVSEVMQPSLMRGGNFGGTLRYTVGIVEYKDGKVDRVAPDDIVFQDTPKLMQKMIKENTKWEAKQALPKEPDDYQNETGNLISLARVTQG